MYFNTYFNIIFLCGSEHIFIHCAINFFYQNWGMLIFLYFVHFHHEELKERLNLWTYDIYNGIGKKTKIIKCITNLFIQFDSTFVKEDLPSPQLQQILFYRNLWNHWCKALYKNRRKKSIFFMYFQSFHIISYFTKLWLLLYFTKLWFYWVLCSNAFHFLHKGLWEYWYTRSISFYVHSHSYGPLCVMCARIFLYKMHIIHISDIVYWVF